MSDAVNKFIIPAARTKKNMKVEYSPCKTLSAAEYNKLKIKEKEIDNLRIQDAKRPNNKQPV